MLGLLKIGCGDEDGKIGQLVLRGLITGSDEHLGIEVQVILTSDLLQLKGVLVAVVGDDVDVRRRSGNLGLYADEAAGDMTAVEYPVHRVSGEDIGDLFLRWQNDERRLQQAGADHRRRSRLGNRNCARCIGLKRVRFRGGIADHR